MTGSARVPTRGRARGPIRTSALVLLLTVALVGAGPGAVVHADVGAPLTSPAPQGPAASRIVTAADAVPGPVPLPSQALGVAPSVGAVLVEGATGQVLVAGDPHSQRPVASAIKLVTALAVVDALPVGSKVTVGEEVRGLPGSSYELRPGEVRTVEDLLVGLLLRSGNDAAVALAVAVDASEAGFVERMQRTLAAIGVDARPASSSGLEEGDALSALDLATVARAALQEPRIRELAGLPSVVLPDGTEIENRNLFLLDMDGATGLKTGFTSQAGFTLVASAERGGRELIAVVLGAQDDLERRALAVRMLEHGFSATEPSMVAPTLRLRTASGDVVLEGIPQLVTVPLEAGVVASWPVRLSVEDAPATVDLALDGRTIGVAGVERRDERVPSPDRTLGRALADGAYAAMRSIGLAGGEGGVLR